MPGPAFRRNEAIGLHTVERDDLDLLQTLRNDPAVRYGLTFSEPENMQVTEEWFEEHVSDTDEGAQFMICPRETATDGGASTVNAPAAEPEAEADSETAAAAATDEDESGPTPVGFVSLFDVQRPEGHAKIAACVDPRHQGAGYATAATRELVAYGIEELRLNRIKAGALVTNERARAVLERVGFTETVTQHQEKRVDGEFVDVVGYSMLAEDWFDRPETTRGIPDSPPGATAEARGHENPFAVESREDDAGKGGDR